MTDANAQARSVASASNMSEAAVWLAAIVENSDDAILSKTLDGIITSWNRGAERVFGYSVEEAIGRPMTLVIPEDRHHEEDDILRRLRSGERIDHFETIRRRKDGALIEVSIIVSPVRNAAGEILGASKIARDITAQKRTAAQQSILLREMHHRIKNLFTLAGALIKVSAKSSVSAADLAADLSARMHALARAHTLTLPDLTKGEASEEATTFGALLKAILAPHEDGRASRISITGADAPLKGNALTSVALLLHEFATNAVKYGALSYPEGKLNIELNTTLDTLRMVWREQAEQFPPQNGSEGFGSTLERAALQGIRGSLMRDWHPDGLTIVLEIPFDRLVE